MCTHLIFYIQFIQYVMAAEFKQSVAVSQLLTLKHTSSQRAHSPQIIHSSKHFKTLAKCRQALQPDINVNVRRKRQITLQIIITSSDYVLSDHIRNQKFSEWPHSKAE